MANVAFLGLGAMGSRMATNLLKAGHQVTVWNRTPAAAKALVEAGARLAASPREAASGASFVAAMVRDDEASRQVWLDPEKGAFAGMAPDAVAIESSTLSLAWIQELGKAAAGKGIPFIEAPVSGTRPQAESAQLIYLVGGEEAAFRKAEPILKAMGSLIHHIGPVGTGALTKLSTNTLLGIQATVIAELIGILKRSGVDAAKVMEAVASTSVWSPIATRHLNAMLSNNFSPLFPVELIEKDFRYTLEAAGSPASAPTIAGAHKDFQDAIERGFGDLNHTAVLKLFVD